MPVTIRIVVSKKIKTESISSGVIMNSIKNRFENRTQKILTGLDVLANLSEHIDSVPPEDIDKIEMTIQ